MSARRLGVRELKSRASEVIRAIREDGAEYLITYRGRPVAFLRGLPEDAPQEARGTPADPASEGVYDDYLAFSDASSPDTEQRLDSITWGQWHTMTEAQRLALLDALEYQARPDVDGPRARPTGHPPA